MTTLTHKATRRKKRGGVSKPGLIRLPNAWQPRWYQGEYWNYFEGGGTRGVAVAHRRWGKDDLALNWAGVAAHQRVGSYWHLLPEYAQGRKAIWDAVDEERGVRRIDLAFPEAIRASTDERGMFIKFRCGSTWQVVGSDSYNSAVGSSPVGITFSEWPLANRAAWAYLSPILEKNGGWASFIYTPRGKNHGYDFWNLSQSDPAWFGIRQGVKQTDVFTDAQLVKIKQNLVALYGEEDGEALFMQEYHVSFDVAVMGSYYGRLLARADAEGRILRVPYDPDYPVYTAWDLGLDDATAIWFFQVVGREVRILDYYEVRNQGLIESAKEVLKKPYAYGEHFLPHDVDARELLYAQQRKAQLEAVGLKPIRVGKQLHDVDKVAAVRRVLPRCVWDAQKTEQGRQALAHYHVDYDEKNMTPRKTAKHDWSSHCADAFAELALSIDAVANLGGLRQHTAFGTHYDPFKPDGWHETPVPGRDRERYIFGSQDADFNYDPMARR